MFSTSIDQDPWKSSPSPATSNPFQPVSTPAPIVNNTSSDTQLNDPWGASAPPSGNDHNHSPLLYLISVNGYLVCACVTVLYTVCTI